MGTECVSVTVDLALTRLPVRGANVAVTVSVMRLARARSFLPDLVGFRRTSPLPRRAKVRFPRATVTRLAFAAKDALPATRARTRSSVKPSLATIAGSSSRTVTRARLRSLRSADLSDRAGRDDEDACSLTRRSATGVSEVVAA